MPVEDLTKKMQNELSTLGLINYEVTGQKPKSSCKTLINFQKALRRQHYTEQDTKNEEDF